MSTHADGLPDLVTRSRIGRRLHLGRAAVARAVTGHGFPRPVGRLGDSVVWRWSDVRAWAESARDRPGGPTAEAIHVAEIRDEFREAGFRLRLIQDPDGGWRAISAAIGRPSSRGQPFSGRTVVEAAESAQEWLRTHR